MSVKRQLFLLLLLMVTVVTATAQEIIQHPRVAELEDHLKQVSATLIKTRFPDLPFVVSVAVEPLRRTPMVEPGREVLPWVALQHEELLDEWDDPNSTLYELQNRVTRIQVEINVPLQISDTEIAEMKEALVKNLRLIPARDFIVIERKEWSLYRNNDSPWPKWGAVALLVLLVGLFVIQRLNLGSLSKAISQIGPRGGGAEAGMVAAPVPLNSDSHSDSRGGGAWAQDVNFRDPIKTREIIFQKINDLVANETFPLLDDLTELEAFLKRDPAQFGALLLEFPLKSQRKIFSLGRSRDWFKAFAEPGNLGSECLNVIEKLQRVRPEGINRAWEDLRIQTWRLAEKGPEFLRSMGQEDAFVLLQGLPRFVSIPMAREAFPGAWGKLLDANTETKILPDDKTEKYLAKALELAPRFSFKTLESYRREKDLLDYLKVASVEEERDIYRILEDELRAIRPPFHAILEGEDWHINALLARITLRDLALSMFNVPKHMRIKLESVLTSKQKFMYYEQLKYLDQNHPDPQHIGHMRERIARIYSELRPPLTNEEQHEPAAESEDMPLAS